MTRKHYQPNGRGLLGLILVAALGAMPMAAQSSAEMKELKTEIEGLKASQKAIQKDIKIIRDILSGKQPPLEDVYVKISGAPSLGESTAKVTLVEFSDFECPFCGRYSTQTFSDLINEYVKTGKVKYYFRDFPLTQIHPKAVKAAEAASCAGDQNKYWEAHDRFFANQKALAPNELEGHAVAMGLDQAKFKACLDGGKYAEKVKADMAEGTKLGVRGTPTFFFGYVDPKDPTRMQAHKLLSGAQPLAAFKEIIDNLLNPPPAEKEGGQKTEE